MEALDGYNSPSEAERPGKALKASEGRRKVKGTMKLRIMTFSAMTIRIMTFSAMTLRIMTFNTKTLRIMAFRTMTTRIMTSAQ